MKNKMHKASKIALVAGLALAVFVVGAIYVTLFDWPWNKNIVELGAIAYLEQKYTTSMGIDESKTMYYIFDNGLYNSKYLFTAYPKDNKNLAFNVYIRNTLPIYIDDYFSKSLQEEVNNKLILYIKGIYPDSVVYAGIDGSFQNNSSQSDKEKVQPNSGTIINITNHTLFALNRINEESENIYNIIYKIKQDEYKPAQIEIFFESTDQFMNVSFLINERDLNTIHTKDDIARFIKFTD